MSSRLLGCFKMGYRMSGKLNVREITKDDIHLLANYWDTRDNAMLHAMGADPAKMPTKSQLIESLSNQIKTPISLKKAFALIWRLDDTSIGHNNVNKISFGDHAYMHFHIWNRVNRKQGLGEKFLPLSIPIFFEKLNLKYLICEPFALNPAPNKLLLKLGFEFEKEYETIPGSLNFLQRVNRYKLSADKMKELFL